MTEIVTLKNGLTIVLDKISAVRSVAFGIWVENGSKNETEETSGISHFIEHMLFKGTETRSAKDIADEMDYVGGQINAFTSREYTCYHTRTLDVHFDKAIDVMADMFFNSVFSDAEIKKESGVIIEEISMYEDSPEDLAHELVSLNVFKNNPLSYPILGTQKTVSSFNSAKMKDYFKRNYAPESTVISVAGSFDTQKMIFTIEKYFGSFGGIKIDKKPDTAPLYNPCFIKKVKDIEQAHVCITFPGIKMGTDESYTMSVFDAIFGGGMSSRLFQKIREDRGLVYSIYSCPTAYKTTGMYSVYAGMGAECVMEVISAVSEEIKNLKTDKITAEQIAKTKEQIKSSYIISLESTSNRMISMGRSKLLLDRVLTPDEIIEKIDGVTLDDIYALIGKIFNYDMICAAIVGNVESLKFDAALMP